MIKVGQITKPQGIKGEVKIRPITDSVSRFKQLKYLIIDNVTHKIETVRVDNLYAYVKLENVADRNMAELLRDKFTFVEKSDSVVPEGRFLISDVIKCKVFVDNKQIGLVSEVMQGKANDVYVIKNEQQEILIPIIDGLIEVCDIKNKIINLNAEIYNRVCVI